MKIRINKKKLRKIGPTKNPFLSLANSIIYQQISTKAGDSIYAKFSKLFSDRYKRSITPENFLKLSQSELKSAGISPQKIGYLKDLAEKFVNGKINHKNFHKMTDNEIKDHLIQVKGIGPWTADMFLIFALNREDVLPVGDLGTKKGFQKAFRLKGLPSESQMIRLAEPYRGRRTTLTLYLWHILDNK